MSLPRPIEAPWLKARHAADGRARSASLPLVYHLSAHLSGLTPAGTTSPTVSIVDVGAGTGANLGWLAPHLNAALTSPQLQRWSLVDHDPALLSAVRDPDQSWIATSRHTGSIGDLAHLVKDLPRPRLITCSALLDLLRPEDIELLVDTTVTHADAALMALSVTGKVVLDPPSAADHLIADAFNAHQQRHSDASGTTALAGPTAWRCAADAFADRAWSVQTRATDWELGGSDAALVGRLLTERVEAALELDLAVDTAARMREWLATRLTQNAGGNLSVRVSHVDMLALPPSSISVQMSSPS